MTQTFCIPAPMFVPYSGDSIREMLRFDNKATTPELKKRLACEIMLWADETGNLTKNPEFLVLQKSLAAQIREKGLDKAAMVKSGKDAGMSFKQTRLIFKAAWACADKVAAVLNEGGMFNPPEVKPQTVAKTMIRRV